MNTTEKTARVALSSIAPKIRLAEEFGEAESLIEACIDLLRSYGDHEPADVLLAVIAFCEFREQEHEDLMQLYRKDVSSAASALINEITKVKQ